MKVEIQLDRVESALKSLPRDSPYRIRLDATSMVLRGQPIDQVARTCGVSVSSVRRWLRKAEQCGVESLGTTFRGGRPRRISASIAASLRTELARAPEQFGYDAPSWSGALIARHLAGFHGIRISARQGRRLLAQLGPRDLRSMERRDRGAREEVVTSPPSANGLKPRSRPAWDVLNKERTMHKIKRLATSGLPLEPYVRGLLDLIHEAVPGGAHKPFFPDPANRPVALIQNFPAPYPVIMALRNHWLTSESTPQLSGLSIRFDSQTLKRGFLSKTVWPLEQFMTPQFYRSDGFNECARPLNHHHCICVSYYEDAEAVGFYPLWRESDQPPFSREDIAFLNSSAPFVTHGLRVAQRIDHSVHTDAGSNFFNSSPSWGSGVILLDSAGRVIAADPSAISIFDNLALFNRANSIAFSSRLRDAFEYIAQSLNAIFGDERFSNAQPPGVQFYSQWTGITLKLRGILTHGSQGERYFTVIVERGELAEHRRRRLMFRWGISARELEMLEAVADRKPNHEIASEMRVTSGTFKSYLRRLEDKLDVASVPELRAFAQNNFGSERFARTRRVHR